MIWIALSSYAGIMTVALLSWAESGEKFMIRKFMASALRGLIVSALLTVSSVIKEFQIIDLFWAFIAGAGGDALIKSGFGALGKKKPNA